MKSAENKTTATLHQPKTGRPFFQKAGVRSFFSEAHKDVQAKPFFDIAHAQFDSGIHPIQPKLSIGQPNDQYEVEAAVIADKVVQRLSNHKQANDSISDEAQGGYGQGAQHGNLVQAKCAGCEEEEKLQKKQDPLLNGISRVQRKPIFESDPEPTDEPFSVEDIGFTTIQRKCASCEQEEKLQKKGNYSALSTASSSIESNLNASKGSGSSMQSAAKEQMESIFGADFSNIRVHTGNNAVQMNKALNAQAFTHGDDIYFNQGKYDTNSVGGKHLLAHELTHTVQQSKNVKTKIQRQPAPVMVTPPTPVVPPPQLIVIEGGAATAAEVTAAVETAEVLAVAEGLTFAEAATASGEALLVMEAAGGAEIEAATGPPGWVVGIIVLAAAGALIGVGYLLSTDPTTETSTLPETDSEDESDYGCDEVIKSGQVKHECWELEFDGYDHIGTGDSLFSKLIRTYPGLQKRNPNATTTGGPCPGIGTHTNVINPDGTYFGSIVCCPCCLQEEGVSLTMACGVV